METSSDKIILFPKWKKKLEEDSLEALKNKEFEVALSKLNKLLRYQVNDYEVITGKLICLMELNRYEEAQELCEQLLEEETEHYFQFVHIYLTILFQTNQYGLLMDQVTEELEKEYLPKTYRSQFKQLYELSEKMRMDVHTTDIENDLQELFKMIREEGHNKQWVLVRRLRDKGAVPDDQIIELLDRDEVHPVVKTEICFWLKEARITEKVYLHKFRFSERQTLAFIPTKVPELMEDEVFSEIDYILGDVEHENPTMYRMLEEVLYRYAYVMYPLVPPFKDVEYIAQAIIEVGADSLEIDRPAPKHRYQSEAKIRHYREHISKCQSLYISVIPV